jgi:hypothetical protein
MPVTQLMLYREIVAVFSEIHTTHINTLCGQNVELYVVKLGGMYSYHELWMINETLYPEVQGYSK